MERFLLYPKLRDPLEVSIHTEQGDIKTESYLIFRCPAGIIKPYIIRATFAPIISRFNGLRSVDEICSELSHLGATRQIVLDVVKALEANLILESPRFFDEINETIHQFKVSSIRLPSHAGSAYPIDEAQLNSLINSFMTSTSVGGMPILDALMVPHVDYHRGGRSYGIGYSALRSTSPDVVIILGTSHQASRHLFHLTNKDFSLPCRTFRNDKHLTNVLAGLYGQDRSFEDEFLHKNEHSLELQLPFLAASIASNPTIIPILVGSFHQFIIDERYPKEYEPYQTFVEALKELYLSIIKQGKSVLVIAGVDMAHCGMAFGDRNPLTESDLNRIKDRDQEYLNCIEKGYPESLFDHIAEDGDARKICGFPTMYLVLDLFRRLGPLESIEKLAHQGRSAIFSKEISTRPPSLILDYQQTFNPKSDNCVTFGVAAFPH